MNNHKQTFDTVGDACKKQMVATLEDMALNLAICTDVCLMGEPVSSAISIRIHPTLPVPMSINLESYFYKWMAYTGNSIGAMACTKVLICWNLRYPRGRIVS